MEEGKKEPTAEVSVSSSQDGKKSDVKVSLCRTAATVECYNCHEVITTVTEKTLSQSGLVFVFVLCLLTAICCWIPCVLDQCKDIKHLCPKCGATIGISSMHTVARARRRRSSWVK